MDIELTYEVAKQKVMNAIAKERQLGEFTNTKQVYKDCADLLDEHDFLDFQRWWKKLDIK